MRHVFLCSFALLLGCAVRAQNFEGQWKGSFTAFGTAEQDEYVLEIEITNKTQISGFSYTYFYQNHVRYFTICKITGTLDRASRTVTVTEVEKIKGDVPPGEVDCLQVHTLTYYKGEDGETLEGKWKPAPGFDRGCGFGTTVLSRKSLASVTHPNAPAASADSPVAAATTAPKKAPVAPGSTTKKSPATTTPAKKPATSAAAKTTTTTAKKSSPTPPKPTTGTVKKAGATAAAVPKPKKDTVSLKMQGSDAHVTTAPPPASAPIITPPPPQVRERNDNLIQTITLTSPEIKIELYDDGIIDHDTVTVYFNGKAVIYRAMLTHSPIRATLQAVPGRENDLILFADNLGDIPPNTALMIVYAGGEQYDVRVTSDLKTNGLVRFVLKDVK